MECENVAFSPVVRRCTVQWTKQKRLKKIRKYMKTACANEL